MLRAPEAQLQAASGYRCQLATGSAVNGCLQVVMPLSKIPLTAVKVESADRRQVADGGSGVRVEAEGCTAFHAEGADFGGWFVHGCSPDAQLIIKYL